MTTTKKNPSCCFDLCVDMSDKREDRLVTGTVQKWAVTKDSIKLLPSVHGNDLDWDF